MHFQIIVISELGVDYEYMQVLLYLMLKFKFFIRLYGLVVQTRAFQLGGSESEWICWAMILCCCFYGGWGSGGGELQADQPIA